MGAMILKGSRWIIGDGNNPSIRKLRWLSRPTSFKAFCVALSSNIGVLVANSIDKEA